MEEVELSYMVDDINTKREIRNALFGIFSTLNNNEIDTIELDSVPEN